MAGTRHAKKSLFISFTMITLAYLTGTVTILNYITVIFAQTGSALTEKHSAILISVTQLTGNFVFMNIVERFNRKTLYICSALSTAALFFLFGAYGYFEIKDLGYEWLPPACMSLTIFSSCMGLLPGKTAHANMTYVILRYAFTLLLMLSFSFLFEKKPVPYVVSFCEKISDCPFRESL